MGQKLDDLRKEIDVVDQELLKLLAKRFVLVREIGALKKLHGLAPLDEKRWQEVLSAKLTKAKVLHLSEEFIEKLYTLIHEHAVAVQKKIVS